ncbi:phosphoribosyltransferase [Trinickia fusca]|uniref:Phosphoribosyltransferase n=1 Tax=Trinickia fusca TaxID=2419777 RepID=A0A494XPI3_9BURK|nr:phosphoribosyltransferase family protein [Trinickia fusca]RKP52560.1 phosphoribosyltransferase [Trinickia fusca]
MFHSLFHDRVEAGRLLAECLRGEAGANTVVLALPRGGVPVAFEVAMALDAELDVLPVRKLGVPTQPELAMGAIAPGGARYVDEHTVRAAHVTQAQFDAVLAYEQAELARRETLYRGELPPLVVAGRTVILVDDGMATGASMQAAVRSLRALHPARIVVALPVAPAGAEADFHGVADAFIAVAQPALFFSVGQHYDDFDQTSDDEVRVLLARAAARPHGASGDA